MRYALISDIHANETALRAVLQDAADAQVDEIVCLGDVLGYGPDPVATLELVYRKIHICLAGNHDDAIAGRCATEDFTDFAAEAVARQRKLLTREALDWLGRLPYTCALDGFACAHGDFAHPERFDYVLEPADAQASWEVRREQLLFVGHTHKPGIFVIGAHGQPHFLEPFDFALEDGKRYLVNVGSVGYPRSGVCRSSYCVYDTDAKTVCFRSLPFDLDAYAAKMHGQGLHEAPWVGVRAAEQRRPEVRRAAAFGRPKAPAKRSKAVRVAPPPAGTRVSVPSGGRSAVIVAPPPERRNLGPALVLAAAGLALAGVVCAWKLASALRESASAEKVADVAVAETPVAAPAPEARTVFRDPRPLSGGWTAAFERPDEQKATIVVNRRRNRSAFQLASPTAGAIRLVKTLPLFEKPAKVYYSTELLSTRPGVKNAFQFTTRVRFLDARGRILEEVNGGGKVSERGRHAAVPAGAETAELAIDCRMTGVFELAQPYFKTEPERKDGSHNRKRKD